MPGPLKRYPDGRGGFELLNDVDARKAGHNPANGLPRRGPVVEVPDVAEGSSPEVFEHGEQTPKGALPKAGPTHRARAQAEAAKAAADAEEARVTAELAALSIEDLAAVVELGDLSAEDRAALAELAGQTPATNPEEGDPVTDPADPKPAPDAPQGAPDPADKARPAPSPGGRRRRPATPAE